MHSKAKRTDIIVLLVILIIVLFCGISSFIRNSSNISAKNPTQKVEDYNGKTLGTFSGSQFEAVTAEKFPDSPLVYYSGVPELYAALETNKIDGFVMSEVTLRLMGRQGINVTWLPEVLNTRYRYFGFEMNAKGEKLRAQMNEMLSEFNSDGTLEQLENIWYGEDESLKVVDDSSLTGENGTLQIGVISTDEPYNYVSNNQITGLNIDLVTRFAKRYGYALDYTDCDCNSLLMGLQTGKYDMLASTLSYSEERAKTILFSEPVFKFDTVLAVRGNNAEADAEDGFKFFSKIASNFEKTFIRENRWELILMGICTTCLITVAATLIGTVLAFAICLFRRTGSVLANKISDIYVKILQGTPMVVLLLILYYIVFGKSEIEAEGVAIIAFALNFGAYTSETLKSGISSIDPGQREAALALGFTENRTFFGFILPQAVKRIMPVYKGEIISLLKGTAVAGYISVMELTKMSDIIRSRTYEAFFPLISTALIYFILAWVLSKLLEFIMKSLDSRRL